MLATYLSVKYFNFRQTEYQDQALGQKTKRISSVLILLFIVPSIWSAFTLIRQNNFEENATAFAEHNKAYGKSIIYDYEIHHKDGSRIELFFTGEAITEQSKEAIYQSAAEHGIAPEQLLINDHTTREDVHELELVKGIYEKMDKETSWRDEEISKLKKELKAVQGNDLPYVQLTREIKNAYPVVTEVHMSQGASVTSDSLKVSPSLSVIVSCSEALSPEDVHKLQEWLKIRLEKEEVILLQK